MTWIFRWATYIDFLNYGWQAMAIAGFDGLVCTPARFITRRVSSPAAFRHPPRFVTRRVSSVTRGRSLRRRLVRYAAVP